MTGYKNLSDSFKRIKDIMKTLYGLRKYGFYILFMCCFLVTGMSGQVKGQESLEQMFQDLAQEDIFQPSEESNQPRIVQPADASQAPRQSILDTPTAADSQDENDPFAQFREAMGAADGSAQQPQMNDIDFGLEPPAGQAKSPEDLEAEIRGEAFNAAVNGYFPLRPDEIRRFLEVYDEVKQASNTRIYPYPQPESKVAQISLDPHDEPAVVKMAAGLVTTISMLDATGQPWPVENMTWAGDFEVVVPQEGGHRIRITPLSEYAYGNVSMTFEGLSAPVILTLATQREMVHVRFDARIPALGPFAKPPLMGDTGPHIQAGSVEVVSVLDGTLPNSAVTLQVTGTDGRTKAYKMNERVYLRTPLTLISPAWMESAASADGMNVYVLEDTPVVLLSEKGKVVRAFISEKEQNL
jgi:intracellular multiplication protein IcmK